MVAVESWTEIKELEEEDEDEGDDATTAQPDREKGFHVRRK